MNALSNLISYVFSFLSKININYFTTKRNNFLILNLKVSDRKFFSDILYHSIGITRTYRKPDGITTKFSEMVLTKDNRFIFYKNQSFLENSIDNLLEFANDSKMKMTEINGLIYMINLLDYNSIKYSEFELDFILKCFSEIKIRLNIVFFNTKGNEKILKDFMNICNIDILNENYQQNISCYICELHENSVNNFLEICNETIKENEYEKISETLNFTK
jgi:hypothetical protein